MSKCVFLCSVKYAIHPSIIYDCFFHAESSEAGVYIIEINKFIIGLHLEKKKELVNSRLVTCKGVILTHLKTIENSVE